MIACQWDGTSECVYQIEKQIPELKKQRILVSSSGGRVIWKIKVTGEETLNQVFAGNFVVKNEAGVHCMSRSLFDSLYPMSKEKEIENEGENAMAGIGKQ